MTNLLNKLNFKSQEELVVLDAPPALAAELDMETDGRAVPAACSVHHSLDGLKAVSFALVFVQSRERIGEYARQLAALAVGDVLLWFAYPKASSKNYRCNFNRDNGWDELGRLGYEPVRQVAVDADWSALRFRKVEYIQTMIRDPAMALSEKGKAKTRS